ncbi:MAG TPA: SRPBCC domain-containing protein [Chloroflexota bacterium]|nr:SRPBCC domain-containing protein [Chloroflexota bacterium]
MAHSGSAGSTRLSTEKTRPPLVYQLTVASTPSAVFDAFFRQPETWLCRSANVDARVGGELRLCWPDGCFAGRFMHCAPPTNARFSWHMDGDPLPETMVVISFESADGGSKTALEVEHYGFGVGADWDMLYVGCARAWASYLKNLRAVLELGTDLREPDE